jgi:DNA (cytosine-5)-methyltransferase 1
MEVPEELLTVAQAAKYLKLSEKTIRRLIKSHQMIASKVGDRSWRIKTSNIDEYLNAHTNGGEGASCHE